jgi:hypothetical protein
VARSARVCSWLSSWACVSILLQQCFAFGGRRRGRFRLANGLKRARAGILHAGFLFRKAKRHSFRDGKATLCGNTDDASHQTKGYSYKDPVSIYTNNLPRLDASHLPFLPAGETLRRDSVTSTLSCWECERAGQATNNHQIRNDITDMNTLTAGSQSRILKTSRTTSSSEH